MLKINRRKSQQVEGTMKADRRLCLTRDDRVVEVDDPDGAFLFAPEGGTISVADAERYGLGEKGDKVIIKERSKPEDKAIHKPGSTKEQAKEKKAAQGAKAK